MTAATPSDAPTRGRPRDPELDEQILVAAAALVDEGGLDALTMDAVAHRAGVAKATIYRRFPAKVDLLVATCLAVTGPTTEAPDTGSVRGDLREVIRRIADTIRGEDGGRIVPAMILAAADNPEVREALHRFSAARRSRMATVVERGVQRGELVPDTDTEVLADQLVGGVLYRHLVTGRSLGPAAVDRMVDQALRGAACRR